MLIGVGIDTVDIEDFARRLERGTLLKVFSARELAYANSHPERRIEILGARWAAREAFAKALGAGLRAEWPLDQIEVVHDDNGRPHMEIGPALEDVLPPRSRIFCSLSHTPVQAVAIVCIEQE